MAKQVIKWTDTNAPELLRVDSSLISVLDFCLPNKGWVKEFSGTGKAVYRAGTGERKFYRVLNDGSFYYGSTIYQYCHAKITAYDTMTDVDTGAGQWAESYFPLSINGTAVARPWMCIFDEKSVLLITIPSKTTGLTLETANSQIMGFGETIVALPGNTARNFLAGHGMNNAPGRPEYNYCPLVCAGTYALNASNYGKITANRSLDGTRTGINVGLVTGGGGFSPSTIQAPFAQESTTILSYPYYGDLLHARPMLDDGIAGSPGDYIPWLYYPCQKASSFDNWGTCTALDSTQFIAIKVVTAGVGMDTTIIGNLGAILIKITEE